MKSGSRSLRLCVLLSLALSGCSSINGAPPMPGDPSAEIARLAKLHDAQAIANCVQLPAEAQIDCRDTIIQARMIVVDAQYTRFRQNFYGEARWGGFAATVATLALTATASLTGVSASTARALSAAATGVTGARAAFEKDILVDRTATSIETAMDSGRDAVAARIRSGMRTDTRTYSLSAALSDLQSYYNAGTLLGALAGINQAVGAQAEKATQELKLATGYRVYSGFNSSAAVSCITGKRSLPDPAGRDNRRKLAASFRTADWVPLLYDPNTDPALIAAAAKAVGC